MAKPKTKNITKQIAFSKEMVEKANSRAREFGVSFAEYLRYLVIEDYKEYQQRKRLITYPIKLPPEVEEQYEKEVEKALKSGKAYNNVKDLLNDLNS